MTEATQDQVVVAAAQTVKAAPIAFSAASGASLSSFDEAWRIAKVFAASTMVPKDYIDKPENCLVAIQMGAELGLKPVQSLQGIAVINGRPSIWGDALWALVQASQLVEDCYETYDPATQVATCAIKRVGRSHPTVVAFSKDDAVKAGLWGKSGPWQQYPARMLAMRARAFCARNAVPDVLKGLAVAEEAQDMQAMPERDMGMLDSAIDDINQRLKLAPRPTTDTKSAAKPAAQPEQPDPPADATQPDNTLTYAEVRTAIERCTSQETLDIASDLIGSVADPKHRAELSALVGEKVKKGFKQ